MANTDYRYNWETGVNPLCAGLGADRFFHGLGLPARLRPVRVGTGMGESSSGSWEACLTQVAESPWSEDDAGVAIDVDNVWALRTRCWGNDEGGDIEWWTFVPRVLPVGYTPKSRRHIPSRIIYDHLGDNPLLGVVEDGGFGYTTRPVRWRTATGQYPSDLGDSGYLWVPMNLNQQVWTLTQGPGVWKTEVTPIVTATNPGTPCTGGIGWTSSTIYKDYYHWGSISSHVGFRGGKIKLWLVSNSSAYACGYTAAGKQGIIIGYEDPGTTLTAPNLPSTVVYADEFDVSALPDLGPGPGPDGTGFYTYRWGITIDIPECHPPLGEVKDFHFFTWDNDTGETPQFFTWYMSPRHDVPLWYWSSTRNRVAPGGIVLP